ncbi:ATP-dependent nuclease [Polaromonas sp. YR568]|uniref:ATP-dependent nuclease n=1 Tax=Polaromonas sp. YR568 TaxID=1855301 RepID=UPI00398C168C
MRVTTVNISGFRSFAAMESPLQLDQITVLIGANNSGKSSILRALHTLQVGHDSLIPDVRVGGESAVIDIHLEHVTGIRAWPGLSDAKNLRVQTRVNSPDRRGGGMDFHVYGPTGNATQPGQLPQIEPDHFIVPYFSKRKTVTYSEDVRSQFTRTISSNLHYLAAKLSRLANPDFPGSQTYRETCKAILGFVVTTVPSDNGQRPGIYLDSRETLPIDQMGEGVPNIVGLLADLTLSEGKLFLIEEPENDLHPTALKALLELIVESAKKNQFVVSTHSNIVVRHLCAAAKSKLYSIKSVPGKLPVEAKASLVETNASARLEVLRDLGYSFSDFELWDGWLILEEASAERLIRDYLVPWFVPKLARVRTMSTQGVDQIQATFEDFNRLVRFTHLEQAYKNAAWVRADGDDAGRAIVEQLRQRYTSWNSQNFACFEAPQFECYYPEVFKDKVAQTLSIVDKKKRRAAKISLSEEVRTWLDEDTKRAKAALLISAKEIIADLKEIAKAF